MTSKIVDEFIKSEPLLREIFISPKNEYQKQALHEMKQVHSLIICERVFITVKEIIPIKKLEEKYPASIDFKHSFEEFAGSNILSFPSAAVKSRFNFYLLSKENISFARSIFVRVCALRFPKEIFQYIKVPGMVSETPLSQIHFNYLKNQTKERTGKKYLRLFTQDLQSKEEFVNQLIFADCFMVNLMCFRVLACYRSAFTLQSLYLLIQLIIQETIGYNVSQPFIRTQIEKFFSPNFMDEYETEEVLASNELDAQEIQDQIDQIGKKVHFQQTEDFSNQPVQITQITENIANETPDFKRIVLKKKQYKIKQNLKNFVYLPTDRSLSERKINSKATGPVMRSALKSSIHDSDFKELEKQTNPFSTFDKKFLNQFTIPSQKETNNVKAKGLFNQNKWEYYKPKKDVDRKLELSKQFLDHFMTLNEILESSMPENDDSLILSITDKIASSSYSNNFYKPENSTSKKSPENLVELPIVTEEKQNSSKLIRSISLQSHHLNINNTRASILKPYLPIDTDKHSSDSQARSRVSKLSSSLPRSIMNSTIRPQITKIPQRQEKGNTELKNHDLLKIPKLPHQQKASFQFQKLQNTSKQILINKKEEESKQKIGSTIKNRVVSLQFIKNLNLF